MVEGATCTNGSMCATLWVKASCEGSLLIRWHTEAIINCIFDQSGPYSSIGPQGLCQLKIKKFQHPPRRWVQIGRIHNFKKHCACASPHHRQHLNPPWMNFIPFTFSLYVHYPFSLTPVDHRTREEMEGNEGNQGKWVSQSPRRAVTADHSNFGAKQSRNTVAVDFGCGNGHLSPFTLNTVF